MGATDTNYIVWNSTAGHVNINGAIGIYCYALCCINTITITIIGSATNCFEGCVSDDTCINISFYTVGIFIFSCCISLYDNIGISLQCYTTSRMC